MQLVMLYPNTNQHPLTNPITKLSALLQLKKTNKKLYLLYNYFAIFTNETFPKKRFCQ